MLVLGSVAPQLTIGFIMFLKVGEEEDFRQVGNKFEKDLEVTTSWTDENNASGSSSGIVVETQCV